MTACVRRASSANPIVHRGTSRLGNWRRQRQPALMIAEPIDAGDQSLKP